MELQNKNIQGYIKKINLMEKMLNEIKQGFFILDNEFQESIKRGEKDIEKGDVFVCKNENELDDFFNSI